MNRCTLTLKGTPLIDALRHRWVAGHTFDVTKSYANAPVLKSHLRSTFEDLASPGICGYIFNARFLGLGLMSPLHKIRHVPARQNFSGIKFEPVQNLKRQKVGGRTSSRSVYPRNPKNGLPFPAGLFWIVRKLCFCRISPLSE